LDLGWLKGDACHGLGPGQFCTFSHPKFNRGLGIAFITTDAILEDVSSWLTLQPPDARGGSLAAVPPYEAKQILGKGVGLIANRDIRRGELIMARTPAVLVDGAAFNKLSATHLTQALAHAIKSLPYDHQHEYLQLSTHDDATTYEERVYKIFAKNNFRTKFHNGKDFHSTFTEGSAVLYILKHSQVLTSQPVVSRINHDCRPNSGYHFDASMLSQKVYAARDIKVGEELSIAYYEYVQSILHLIHMLTALGSPIQDRDRRQHQLLSHWGFECTCKHCTADPDSIAQSDRNVGQIHALWSDLDDYSPASRGSTDKAEQLLELYKLEGLDTRMHEAYYRASIEWNGVGNSAAAVDAARMCLDRGEQMRGPKAPFAKNMRELIQDPQKHWSWRFRLPNAHDID
jgi:hypothetical protein